MSDGPDLVEELIQRYCPPDSSWVPSVQASRIIDELNQTPAGREALAGWLSKYAHQLLTAAITKRRPRATGREQRFQATLRAWDEQHSCPGNVMRATKDMTRADHEYVASRYTMTARTANFLAAFHQAVADKLAEGQVTSDVFSAETYDQMYASITS